MILFKILVEIVLHRFFNIILEVHESFQIHHFQHLTEKRGSMRAKYEAVGVECPPF